MKILIIRCTPDYMEVQNASYNIQEVGLARALIKKGHQCDIVFWTGDAEKDVKLNIDENSYTTIFYRNAKAFLKNAIYTDIDKLISQYDVIQTSEHNQIFTCMLARKYPEKTVVYHGPYYSSFNTKYNLMCKVFDRFVIPVYKKHNTQFMTKSDLANDYLVKKGLKSQNVHTVGVGIDLDSFKEIDEAQIPHELKAIKDFESELKLLYIGRFENRRNIPFLFDTVKELTDRGINTKLVMIGNGNEDYVSSSFDYAKSIGVYDNICHIKKMEQKYLQYAYKNTDAFLLPTRYEIFGMVLLEAMYFGTPAITTNNGGSQMLIENGIDGAIIDEFDAKKWADEIIKIKGNENVKRASCQKIAQCFTWDKVADDILSIYKKKTDI